MFTTCVWVENSIDDNGMSREAAPKTHSQYDLKCRNCSKLAFRLVMLSGMPGEALACPDLIRVRYKRLLLGPSHFLLHHITSPAWPKDDPNPFMTALEQKGTHNGSMEVPFLPFFQTMPATPTCRKSYIMSKALSRICTKRSPYFSGGGESKQPT
jgi:hypothetical protein